MPSRYTAHIITDDGPDVMAVVADGLSANEDALWFHRDGAIVAGLPLERMRMLFRDDLERG
uniref:hypothetical protein n=1 Tax=Pseudonocardia sp. CA-138482 TaxID=3240023 RepID=UPI003F490577